MDIAKYLNETVWCKLAPSPIHGIGVFAVQDIPKGTLLYNYSGDRGMFSCDEKQFEEIKPEIREIIVQRYSFLEGKPLLFYSPNASQVYQSFMNHSSTPNSDGQYALRDILKGEEITEDFKAMIDKPHEITKIRNDQLK